MKKIFLILILSLCCVVQTADSRTTEMNNIEELRSKRAVSKEVNIVPAKNIETVEDYKNYIKERFEKAETAEFEEGEDLTSMNSMNIQHSQEYISQMKEQGKGTFEKIYDAAIARLTSEDEMKRQDVFAGGNTVFYREVNEQEQQNIQAPDIPTVDVILPTGKKILAPAAEHIPYMFTNIEIMPTGLIKIDETVVAVADGQKLANGLTRMLPKESISRDGVRHKINYELIEARVNNQNIKHEFKSFGNKMLLKPVQDYILSPGVYTYEFSYIIDRQLWEYADFNEFYWDVAGSNWNLIISKAAAVVSFSGVKPSISQNVLIGYRENVSPYRAKVIKHDDNTIVFTSSTPILIGEGMHILLSLPKDNFIAADMNKRFEWFIEDYGDNLFAILGFLAILLSYALSWYYIKNNKTNAGQGLRRTPAILRYLLLSKFDAKSFGGILLDLYRRNILDIERNEKEIVLIKKNDNIKTLGRGEQAVVSSLFGKNDTILPVNHYNALKLKRAYIAAQKDNTAKIKALYLRLNLYYMLFSVAMLLVAEIAIALNSVNFWQTILILISSDIVFAFYVSIIRADFENKILRYALRIFGVLFIVIGLLILSVYIMKLASVLILAMIITIFAYSSLFSKRNGLLRTKIKDMIKYRAYLENHAQDISLGRDYLVNQPNIFALDLENNYTKAPEEYDKIAEIKDILQLL